MRGQPADGVDEGVADLVRGAPLWQEDLPYVAGGALDHSGDGPAVVLADDQVAFPVPGRRPVTGLGGAFADHDHRGGHAGVALLGLAPWAAHRAAGARRSGQLAPQLAAALAV